MSIEVEEKEIRNLFANMNANGISLLKIRTERRDNSVVVVFSDEEIEYLKNLAER